jgi:hypothetical protein
MSKLALVAVLICAATFVNAGEIATVRVPNGGIQPQVALDATGTLHLIYFKGEAAGGDIFYVKSADFGKTFSAPVRVNSQEQSSIAIGNIRGAHLALGKGNRVHVAWMGSNAAEPRGPGKASPMLYTRLNDAGTAFEEQRNVIASHYGLDGGGTVTADESGNVCVIWGGRGEVVGENNRRIYVARSNDDGKSFAPETAVNPKESGVCACCGLTALAAPNAGINVLYRAAGDKVNRGMTLLTSLDRGATFKAETLDEWKINTCPMSSAALIFNGKQVLRAWENTGQVFFASGSAAPIPAPGPGRNRKHPVVAQAADGRVLFAWTEGMGWEKGGRLAWQLYDKAGQPLGAQRGGQAVPVWSLIAAVPTPDNGFVILY